MTLPMFFYGTLRDPDIRRIVIGPHADDLRAEPAVLRDHALFRVKDEDYPLIRPVPGGEVAGLLVHGIGADDKARIAFFECDGEYAPRRVEVETAAGPAEALLWQDETPEYLTDQPWSFEAWQETAKPLFAEAVREFMDHFGKPIRTDMDIWDGILIRAAARLRAAAERPVRRLRKGLARADVRQCGLDRPYAAHFGIEEHRIRHRRFDGGWSPELMRAAFVSGDAVTVLPYDPVRDRVLMIEQWRAGPWARGDAVPWTLEAIAGRCDAGEDAETTARREAREEAGLRLGRLERIAAYYPSPGIMAENITSYVGEAELDGEDGIHGLDGENEDIRAFAVSFDRAMEAVADGEVNNAPLLISLIWLARERDRLRREWAGSRA
ncbi:MAG: NUDIX domain-containing protein [Alphaproteobacteria bacterium]|nr:MAG: NUDIX domain-containing protein [Alphaproteobacteria bacterium]